MTDISTLIDSLKAYMTPLDTTNPERGGVDLQPILDQIGDARIVGMGETTHGTSEFFELKHRVFRCLVETLGFRLFALEANFSETLAINEYVLHGDGDPEGALDGIYFWVWNTEEVLALLEWMRSFNEERPIEDRIRVYGIDAQYTEGAVGAVQQYLGAVDADYLDEIREDLDSLATDRDHVATLDERRLETAERLVDELGDRFEGARAAYVDRTSADEWTLARQHVRALAQSIEFASILHDRERHAEHRDRCMAANVDWILNYEKTEKIAVWAHNIHVSKGGTDHTERLETPLGEYLAERFGDAYYALGFEFGHGSFRAYSRNPAKGDAAVEPIAVGPLAEEWPYDKLDEESLGLPPGALGDPPLADVLFNVDSEFFFVDVDGAASDATLGSWLRAPHLVNRVGALFLDSRVELRCVAYEVPNVFDGLLFVKETNASVPLS